MLVCNAGVTRDGLIARLSPEAWTTVIDTNLAGPFFLCQAVSRRMMRRRSGSIVLMSSVVGVHGNAGQTNYSASKAGLIGLGEVARARARIAEHPRQRDRARLHRDGADGRAVRRARARESSTRRRSGASASPKMSLAPCASSPRTPRRS